MTATAQQTMSELCTRAVALQRERSALSLVMDQPSRVRSQIMTRELSNVIATIAANLIAGVPLPELAERDAWIGNAARSRVH